jgi:hypothetical protein
MPGFTKISNDNARPRPPTIILPFGVSFGVSFALAGAVDVGAELPAVGALAPLVLVDWLVLVVGADSGAVADSVGILGALVTANGFVGLTAVGVVTAVAVGLITLAGFRGLTGETGDVTFVGFDIDFTHVLVVVVHGPITGCP